MNPKRKYSVASDGYLHASSILKEATDPSSSEPFAEEVFEGFQNAFAEPSYDDDDDEESFSSLDVFLSPERGLSPNQTYGTVRNRRFEGAVKSPSRNKRRKKSSTPS